MNCGQHFGVDAVAEMTGRKMRILTVDGKTEAQQRAAPGTSHEQVNVHEKTAFLQGKKRIAIISEAASSGISLHADHRFRNQQRRYVLANLCSTIQISLMALGILLFSALTSGVRHARIRYHITLELAWSAEKMLQQFGRTHRSNQACAPHYVLLVTDVGGEQRFASSVARRLELLGAMTRGDRRGGHGAAADLVQFNLDTYLGHTALAVMLDAVGEKAEKERLWERALQVRVTLAFHMFPTPFHGLLRRE